MRLVQEFLCTLLPRGCYSQFRMKPFTVVFPTSIVFRVSTSQPALPTGPKIAFRQYPHAPNKSEYVPIDGITNQHRYRQYYYEV